MMFKFIILLLMVTFKIMHVIHIIRKKLIDKKEYDVWLHPYLNILVTCCNCYGTDYNLTKLIDHHTQLKERKIFGKLLYSKSTNYNKLKMLIQVSITDGVFLTPRLESSDQSGLNNSFIPSTAPWNNIIR